MSIRAKMRNSKKKTMLDCPKLKAFKFGRGVGIRTERLEIFSKINERLGTIILALAYFLSYFSRRLLKFELVG